MLFSVIARVFFTHVRVIINNRDIYCYLVMMIALSIINIYCVHKFNLIFICCSCQVLLQM